MSETEREKMLALDEAAEIAGGYVTNIIDKSTQYNLREIIKYCEEKDKNPIDLTLRELSQFTV